ncbi:membrane hypothetical protein [Gammaproteobacteria bacterium]
MSRSGVVAVAGSRSLPSSAAPLVSAVCQSVVRSGRSVVVGCALGADALVLSAGLPLASVSCLAAFGPGGAGSCPASAVGVVSSFAAAGGSVSWLAGSSLSRPVRARLGARSAAVVAAASVACVVFFSSPSSRGSSLVVSIAARRSLPVYAFPVGFAGSALVAPAGFKWVSSGCSGVWSSSFSLFPF